MYNELLITVLLIIVSVLLILDIIIAITILRLLKSFKRAARVIDKIVDDIEKFGKVVSHLTPPPAWGRFIKKIAGFLPNQGASKKEEEKK